MSGYERRLGPCSEYCAVVDECEARGDVIKELRAENERLREDYERVSKSFLGFTRKCDDYYETLNAENERLREALKPFAAASITYEPCGFMIEWDIIPCDIDAARKALGETE